MRIGIYFAANKASGGVFEYSLTILEAFSRIKNNDYFIFSTSRDIPAKFRSLRNFHFINLFSKSREKALVVRDTISDFVAKYFPIFFKILYKLGIFELFKLLIKLSNRNIISIIKSKHLDLIFYPTTSNLSFVINVPSIVSIHDLHHRLTPWFKEASAGGRWELREYTYLNVVKNAYRLLVESNVGKENLLRFYEIKNDQVVVLPMVPPSYITSKITRKEIYKLLRVKGIQREFLYYPAKFWPHKNHLRIVKALHLLKQKGILLDLVLSGSKNADFSTFDEVMNLSSRLGISRQIKYLGFVDVRTLSTLYKGSLALVMPTFFGATNLPVLEAWKVGTAVIYSDICGCRDQLGNAGLLVNPKSYRDIAGKIEEVYNNRELRRELIKRGTKRSRQWTEKEFVNKVVDLIKGYKAA